MLYGATQGGGDDGAGTIFSIDMATRQERTLFGFPHRAGSIPYPAGARPMSPLIFVNGVCYGTASGGGSASRYGSGTLFSLTP